jgi:hypothetical protein
MTGRPASEILFDTDMGVEPADFVPEFTRRGGGIVIFGRLAGVSEVSWSSWRRIIWTMGFATCERSGERTSAEA